MSTSIEVRPGRSWSATPAVSRNAALYGLVLGAATATVYSTKLFSPFDADGATTVGWYIHHPGVVQIFLHNTAYSNHVLFSFLEKLIYLASGRNQGEAVLRVLPIAAAAASVGLLTASVSKRWGLLAGTAAGVVLASNPLFASHAWAIRGYSMVVFFALASTLALMRMVAVDNARPSLRVVYVGCAAVGIATHLFMIPVVVLQAAFVLSRRHPTWQWVRTFIWVGVLGLLPYTLMAKEMIQDRGLGRSFDVGFPVHLANDSLGGSRDAMVIAAALLTITIVAMRRIRVWIFVGAPALAMLMVLWLIWQPWDIGTRYFLWVVPAVAVGCAYAVHRAPVLILAVAVLVGLQIRAQDVTWSTPKLAEKPMGAIVQREHDRGRTVCSVGFGGGPLSAYTRVGAFTSLPPTDIGGLQHCADVVMLTPEFVPASMRRALNIHYPYKTAVASARVPAILYSLAPISSPQR